jgi:putative MFS transporter
VFLAGPFMDLVGRRIGAVVIFCLLSFGVFGSYTFHARGALTVALLFGVFGATAFLPVLNAYNTELFPTELRGSAFAWANNLIGRVGYVLSPIGVGVAVERFGWSATLRATTVFPLLALGLILLLLPETRGRELEKTAEI